MMDQTESDTTLTPAEGRKRVEDLLLSRLRAAGFRKPKGLAQGDFENGQAALADRLAYLSTDNLQILAECIVDAAPLPNFPNERWLLDMAATLQKPPVRALGVLRWLTSVEGPKAVARGDLLALYRFLMANKRPPTAWEMRKIGEEAVAEQHRVLMWRERIMRGVALDADRAGLARYEANLSEAMALVDAGNAKRAAEGAAA